MKRMNKGKDRMLTALVLAWLAAPTFSASAQTTEYSDYEGKHFIELSFMGTNDSLTINGQPAVKPSFYNLDDAMIQATSTGVQYWTDILAPRAKNAIPWQIVVDTENDTNAAAGTASFISDGSGSPPQVMGENYVTQSITAGKQLKKLPLDKKVINKLPAGDYAYSSVDVGKYLGAERQGATYGWWIDADTVLPTNEQAADYVATVRHELGHALGINARDKEVSERAWEEDDDDDDDSEDEGKNGIMFDPDVKSANSWNMHLVDQNLNPARPGMQIVTSAEFAKLKAEKPTLREKDFFIVDELEKLTNPTGRRGKIYFVGKHVTEVLDGAKFDGVSGLPVTGWEKGDFEGSHLQTTGMMSHRPYSNYTSFMEAELAVMQDLGYDLDRKAYFGRSIYGDDGTIRNTQGYFARNADGTAYLNNTYSTVPLGIGLHIYGSRNNVTQAANILTRGKGATGVRVDGVENRLDIPVSTEIHADGERGNGLLVAYGRNHKITQSGTITARGQGGVGVRFDFGSSSNGARDEYRGSYIRFYREVNAKTGAIQKSENLDIINKSGSHNSTTDELFGSMVDSYDLSGGLAGGEHAIYISKNAFVKNININEGAFIIGDIKSDWKHFKTTDGSYDAAGTGSEPLKIQYEDKNYDYDRYIPNLVTNLNFNARMSYSWDINGADNMKLNIQGGELTYGGTADVVNVTVDKGAALWGGSFKVHNWTDKMPKEFTDDTTGAVINNGTIGAASSTSTMNIKGNLDSEGMLRAYGGGDAGHIQVDGNADIDGSTVTATNMLPGETTKVLTVTQKLTGDVTNHEDAPYAATGMLSTIGIVNAKEKTVEVTVKAANNLETEDEDLQETYEEMVEMDEHLRDTRDDRREEMRPLFSLNANNAKAALSSISSNAAAQSMSMAQTNSMTGHIISSRLTEAYSLKPVKMKIPVAQLADGEEDKSLEIPVKVPQTVDNDFWFKIAKNWGDLKGGADYHGTSYALGWDRAYGPAWRGGAFVSYSTVGFSADGASNRLKDTRLGIYGGYNKGPHSGFIYLDYGWLKNELRRNIAGLNLTPEADYDSRILELGGEYKYDLQANKNAIWHISPYANMQLSRLWQDSYAEKGAGVFGQRVNSAANTYFAGGLGLEFKRYLAKGSYALRLGVKHAFTGADARLTFGYVGNNASSYEMRNPQDKTHFVMSLGGEAEFAPGWWLAGDAGLQKGAHDKDVMCSLRLKRMW